ncbi:mercuric reductase [Taibaiella koreensis]|uniref:mercuric reductase n=1 Tax=Taibaiella koreensis TaxID=1268548 RepID=UPI000E599972|nr:mercuric reductase [Taibaiella koreensis]
MKHFNALIIGSGQAGTPLAIRMAKAGYSTALIEKRAVGGTCINDGCIPSKSIIASARAAYDAAHADALGIHNTQPYEVRFKEIIDRKRQIVDRFRGGSERSLRETENLELIYGTAVFSGEKEVTVTRNDGSREQIKADYIFINTGARPAIPDIPGLKDSDFLTSTSVMELEALPQHLVILGAGYISLEMGQAFRRFGSKVTLIESKSHILDKEDEDIRQTVTRFLEEEGITILTGARVAEVSRNSKQDVVLHIEKNGVPAIVTGSHLLVAAGRQPNSDILQPGNAGIILDDHGYIKVNDRLETNVDRIFALGDAKGGPAFTHISYNDYRIVYRNLVEGASVSTNDRIVPYCMFTEPELGRVGLTEKEAREKGFDIDVARLEMDKASRGIIDHRPQGLLKAIVDKSTGKILGASLLCHNGGEIMSVLQMAMVAGFSYEQVKEHMFAHPTLSESLNNLFFSLER